MNAGEFGHGPRTLVRASDYLSVKSRKKTHASIARGLHGALFPFEMAGLLGSKLFISDNPWFLQERRCGKDKTIEMKKIKSLKDHPDGHEDILPDLSKDRMTLMGMILRQSRIDEISQLRQVARGQIALMGSRPRMIAELEYMLNIIKSRNKGLADRWQRVVDSPLSAGLFCAGELVNIARNVTDEEDRYYNMAVHEVAHYENASPGLETRVLALALPSLVVGVSNRLRGIENATEPNFLKNLYISN